MSDIQLPVPPRGEADVVGWAQRLMAALSSANRVERANRKERTSISAVQFGDTLLTYSGGDLTRIDYPDGTYKELTYSGGKLTQVDWFKDNVIIRKTLTYSGFDITNIETRSIL